MDFATHMWVKSRFDAMDKRLDTLAKAVVSLVETLQTQGAAQMEQVNRIESALADLKVREQALLERDSANATASAQTAADLAVAQAKVKAIGEQLASVSADRESIKAQLDDLTSHLDTMAVNAEAARDALPAVPVAVDPNAGSAVAGSGSSTGSTSTSDPAASAPAGTASTEPATPSDSGAATPSPTSSSTTPASSATPADGSGAPAASSDAGTASAPAPTASTPPDPAQVGSADPTGAAPSGQGAGDTSAVGSPTVVNENVSDGALATDPVK